MSGGHWNYENYRILDVCRNVSNDREVRERFPLLAKKILDTGKILDKIIHDLDWDLEGDTEIKDDKSLFLKEIQTSNETTDRESSLPI